MKTRINHSSYIIGFLDEGFDSDKISQFIKKETDKILKSVHPPELNDWNLIFKIIYNNVDRIYLFRKSKSYSSEKYKEIVIHLPVPRKTEIKWGVNENQLIDTNFKFDNRYCDEIEVDIGKYEEREIYIIENVWRAIVESLKLGITINGKKIKVKV